MPIERKVEREPHPNPSEKFVVKIPQPLERNSWKEEGGDRVLFVESAANPLCFVGLISPLKFTTSDSRMYTLLKSSSTADSRGPLRTDLPQRHPMTKRGLSSPPLASHEQTKRSAEVVEFDAFPIFLKQDNG